MRRAAGYNGASGESGALLPYDVPMPNLPGFPQAPAPPRPTRQTLKYVNGYPIIEDVDVTADPLNRAYKWGNRVQADAGPIPPFALHEAAGQANTHHHHHHHHHLQQQQQQGQHHAEPASSSSRGGVPNWLAYDRKVLGFKGYFREEVPYSALETWRVRRVVVRYYLESDHVEVVEMREENSGLPQGVLLKRHCAVKPDGSLLRWPDLRVGGTVELYKRTYHLVAADASTRAFYAEHGQEQPADEAFPEGPYDALRKAQALALEASRAPRPPTRGAAAFRAGPPLPADPAAELEELLHLPSPRGAGAVFETCAPRWPEHEARDNAVLRFMAAWDNTRSTLGEVLAFSLSYHVSDGTVEVREVHRRNSGRDPFPLLLSRCRLPKTLPPVYGRPMSPRSRAALAIQFYDWRDLKVGITVNVYGRSLLLYDCDEATRAWLRAHVPGIEDADLEPIEVDFDPLGPKRPPLAIPPHTSGIGSEEDSLRNVLSLVPRPPPKPYADYLENWNKVLRFEAAMAPLGPGRPLVGPHDAERRFILSYHLLDHTLAIWEPKRENSGMDTNVTFLERTRVRNPATGRPYEDTDMQVGAVLEIFGRGFQLLDADAYTLRYMEKESARFPWADFDKVMSKLSAWLAQYPDALPDRLRAELLAVDPDGSRGGYISKHRLHALLSGLGSDLSPHEVITVVRQLGADRQGLLAEQLLAALGLAPSPPTPPPLSQAEEPPEAPPEPQAPSVPFPAAGLQHRRVAWAPHPGGPLTHSRLGTEPYRGIGPTPGHPRVEPPPQPYHHRLWGAAAAPQGGGGGAWERPSSAAGSGAGGGGDDRRGVRDTPEKAQHYLTESKAGGRATAIGMGQPASLWATTYSSYGGVGHASSLRR